MTNSNDSLNHCPFCGPKGKPFVVTVGNSYTKKRGADVGCEECGVRKTIRVLRRTQEWAVEEAYKWWNRRA